MWLVLGSYTDTSLVWAFRGLSSFGLAPLEFVASESLLNMRLWEHRVSAIGASLRLTLPNGRMVAAAEISGVLNRMTSPAQNQVQYAVPEDREYASSELMALYLSALHTLECPILNRPTPQGLCGRWFHRSEWIQLAVSAGFDVVPYRQSASDPADLGYRPHRTCTQSVVVLEGKVFGAKDLPTETQACCTRLAKLANLGVMGVDLVRTANDFLFASATPMPQLEPGGVPLLEHLFHTLKGKETDDDLSLRN